MITERTRTRARDVLLVGRQSVHQGELHQLDSDPEPVHHGDVQRTGGVGGGMVPCESLEEEEGDSGPGGGGGDGGCGCSGGGGNGDGGGGGDGCGGSE